MRHPFFEKKEIPGFKKQEKEQSKSLGGKQKPASGAMPPISLKGDFSVDDQNLVVEAKCTENKSYILKYEDLGKIKGIAFQQGKTPALLLRFDFEPRHLLEERDWAVIPFSLLKEFVSERRTDRNQ